MHSLEKYARIVRTAVLSEVLRPTDDPGRLHAPGVMQGANQSSEKPDSMWCLIDFQRLCWPPERRIMSNSHQRLQNLLSFDRRLFAQSTTFACELPHSY
jgi:hypothetical protein